MTEILECPGSEQMTDDHIFQRLRVNGVNEFVMALVGQSTMRTDASKAGGDSDTVDESKAGDAAPVQTGDTWQEVRLISLSIPHACVDVPRPGGATRITIHIDKLRAVHAPSKKKEKPIHHHK